MSKALALATGGLLLLAQGHSAKADPFAYKFKSTPEEGPIGPTIESLTRVRSTDAKK
jgi:hypothetical protein